MTDRIELCEDRIAPHLREHLAAVNQILAGYGWKGTGWRVSDRAVEGRDDFMQILVEEAGPSASWSRKHGSHDLSDLLQIPVHVLFQGIWEAVAAEEHIDPIESMNRWPEEHYEGRVVCVEAPTGGWFAALDEDWQDDGPWGRPQFERTKAAALDALARDTDRWVQYRLSDGIDTEAVRWWAERRGADGTVFDFLVAETSPKLRRP